MAMSLKAVLWKLQLAIKRKSNSGSDDIDYTSMRRLCSTLGLLSRSRLAHSLRRPPAPLSTSLLVSLFPSARFLSAGPSKPDTSNTSDTSDTSDSAAPWSYDRATSWLKKFTKEDIPRDTFTIKYSRSSGPGGQNVNKVSTKATMRFDLASANWIPAYARVRLAEQNALRMTKQGEYIISSDRTRSQRNNVDDCINKLYEEVRRAVEVPKEPDEETKKRVQELARIEDSRRKANKQFRSQKKSDRKSSGGWE